MGKKPWQLKILAAIIALCLLVGYIPVRLAIAHHQAPQPQGILVLGGDIRRMRFAARFMQRQSQLDIWISDLPNNFPRNRAVFIQAKINRDRLYYDSCPTDTVTNFTCLLDESNFQRRQIQHLYLITSDYHMERARAIATLVLGSRGIAVTPLAVPSERVPEPQWKLWRDRLRALVWILTGKTGASLKGTNLLSKKEMGFFRGFFHSEY